MGPQNLSLRPKRQIRSYFSAEQGLPGRQIGMGSPASAFVPAEQGFSGKQIGIGSPDSAFVPTGQLTPGLQGGVGSPLNPFAAPNAIPRTTNKTPSIIFVFTVPLQCRSSGLARILSEDQPRKSLKKPILYATI
jgi:hypothetical protein